MRFLVSSLSLAVAMALTTTPAAAKQGFVASKIKFQGLKRLAPETVYAQLPIASGDRVGDVGLASAIKALYATGHFSNISTSRVGDMLVFHVTERPIISSIEFEGNKLIPEKALKDGLKSAGIFEGETLKETLLARAERDIEQQYFAQGRYNADVVIEKNAIAESNATALTFKFYEGSPAKVVDLTIIGNQHFDKDDIEDVFEVRSKAGWSPFSKKNQYAQQKLAASLENLRALYLDAGFAAFKINDAVLNVSEDRSKIYIEINITEGERYTFGSVRFLGNPKYNDKELHGLSKIVSGKMFSQKVLTKTSDNLKRLYGNAGYYFAKIRPVPRINSATKVVDIDYFIDPAKPIYVRRIVFSGNTKTADTVLRREMRQLEGALASNKKIQLSKVRLQRTGYFKTVTAEAKKVPNSPDKVDLIFTVVEQPSGTTSFAAGYSESGGVTFQAGLTQRNFLGTGNSVNIQLSRSQTVDDYNVSVTDPYFTVDGISQSLGLYYRKTKTDSLNISSYITDSVGAKLSYGYPVDENKRVSAGLGVDKTTVRAGESIAVNNLDYMLSNGGKIIQDEPTKVVDATKPPTAVGIKKRFEADFTTYNLNLGWSMDTRDTPVFPNSGMSHYANLEVALPGSDVEYQKLSYSGNLYFNLGAGFVLRGYSTLGYGNDLPFYKNFFAGGFGTLRGYERSTLGPRSPSYIYEKIGKKDPQPEYVGGNALVQFGGELVLPLPFKGDWTDQVRLVGFAEGAQTFDTSGRENKTFDGGKTPLITQDETFRYTAGVSGTWITAIGPISLSYSWPLNEQTGDSTRSLQFEIGRIF